MLQKSCLWCETKFVKTTHNRKYCSNKCMYLFNRHNKNSKREVYKPKSCIYCGKVFGYNEENKMHFTSMKTCGSEECKKKLRFARLSKTPEGLEHTRKRRDKINKGMRAWKKEIKDKAYTLLGNKCAICGFEETKILQPHHLDSRDKSYRDQIADLKKAMDKGVLEKRFILLCPNHHAIHTYMKVPIKELNKYL